MTLPHRSAPTRRPRTRLLDPAAWAGALLAFLGAGKLSPLGTTAGADALAAGAVEILAAAALLLFPRSRVVPAAVLLLVLGGGAYRLVLAWTGSPAACVCLGPYQAWLGARGTALAGGALSLLLGWRVWKSAADDPSGFPRRAHAGPAG